MKTTHSLQQGSPEWHTHRASFFNASEAAAMLGISPYKTRGELLREKKSGLVAEIDAATQQRFDKGHEYEALAIKWAEEIIGTELYPSVMSDEIDGLPLSASFDGIDMEEVITWEHKSLNQRLRDSLSAGVIPEEYHPQMEQGLLISGATRCLFMASSGEKESMLYAWYESNPTKRKQLLDGWKQFQSDLESYQHVEVLPAAVAEPVDSLPAVAVQVNGQLSLTSNLVLFGEKLKAFVGGLDKNPSDDQAFANCEAAVKTLKKAEDALDAAESTALASIVCINEMQTIKQSLSELARSNRLMLEKLVKTRKETIRVEIRQAAETAFRDHCAVINKRLGKVTLPVIKADFEGVMKAKKSVTSLRDAVDAELARVKIEANAAGERIDANLRSLNELAKDHAFLFMDAQQIVMKDNGDLVNLIKLRISEHEAEAKARRDRELEAEREKIRKEEEARAQEKVALEAKEKARQEAADKAKADAAERERNAPVQTVTATQQKPSVVEVVPAPTRSATVQRPTSQQIIAVLAKHYSVSEDTVIDWLAEIELAA